MKLSKKYFLPLTLLAFITACSQGQNINTPNTNNINQNITSTDKSVVNLSIKGKVDWDNNKFKTKAEVSDIATSATVSLIYPYNHITNANKVIATGLTNSSGEFIIDPSIDFIPEPTTTYILEVSKRIGGATNSLMSLRTYIKRNSGNTDWESITTPSISINSKTTALAILSALEPFSPDKTINSMTVSAGVTTPNNVTLTKSKVTYQGNDGSNQNIYVANVDGTGSPVKVSVSSTENYIPQITPDGSKVTYQGNDGSNQNIYVANVDGTGSPVKVSGTGISNYNFFPQISNDGSKVTYYGYDVNNVYQIYVANVDGTGSPVKVSGTGTTDNSSPQITPDGSKIIYHGTISGVKHVFVANADGTGSPIQISSGTTNNSSPQISGDGSKVTYYGNDASDIQQIYVVKSNGTGYDAPVKISSGISYNYNPQISGDGSKVTYQGDDASDIQQIYVVKSNGTGYDAPVKISSGTTNNSSPQISGDGSKITYYGTASGIYQIYVVKSNGTGYDAPVKVSGTGISTANYIPQITPDGSKITYYGTASGIQQIYVVKSNGLGYDTPVKISSGTTVNSNPQFGGAEKSITAVKINDVANVVNQVLNANYDPLRFIHQSGENYVATYPSQV